MDLKMWMIFVFPVDGDEAPMRATGLQLTLVISERSPPNNNRIRNLIRKYNRTNTCKSKQLSLL